MRVIKPTNKLLEFHPFANVFPLLNGDDFKKFLADIEAHGLSEPVITLYEGKILDGRNRFRANTLRLKRETRCEEFKGDKAAGLAFVISKNIHRRQMTAKGKRDAIAALVKFDPGKSDRQIAETVKADHKTVASVRAEKEATGEVSPVEKRVGKDGKARKQPTKKAVASKPLPIEPTADDDYDVWFAGLQEQQEVALLREFAVFVLDCTTVKYDPKNYRKWKALCTRVKQTLGQREAAA